MRWVLIGILIISALVGINYWTEKQTQQPQVAGATVIDEQTRSELRNEYMGIYSTVMGEEGDNFRSITMSVYPDETVKIEVLRNNKPEAAVDGRWVVTNEGKLAVQLPDDQARGAVSFRKEASDLVAENPGNFTFINLSTLRFQYQMAFPKVD